MRAPAVLLLTSGLILAACGSSDVIDDATEAVTDDGGEDVSLTPAAADGVVLAPGATSEQTITIDDTDVDLLMVAPDGFEVGDEAPVLVVFPPGAQDLDTARATLNSTYAPEALARGWVLVSPAAPDGVRFFQGSETLVPALFDWIDTWVTPEGGGVHLAGISNGGISSFRVAGENPDRVRSVVVFPGFPREDRDIEALDQLTNIPVRLFVGENDDGWVEPAQAAEARLNELGGDAELMVFVGEGHIIGALSDGVTVFDELDAAR
ncbi:MAG: hypothetical protein AAF467_01790 [Actinomycetota bacterium]